MDNKPRMATASLVPNQDCDLALLDSNGGTVFRTGTTAQYLGPQVTPPCRLVVSGAGGGFVAIIDSFASGDQSDTALYTRPFIGNGIMREGQILPQVLLLGSSHLPGMLPRQHHSLDGDLAVLPTHCYTLS